MPPVTRCAEGTIGAAFGCCNDVPESLRGHPAVRGSGNGCAFGVGRVVVTSSGLIHLYRDGLRHAHPWMQRSSNWPPTVRCR